VPLDLTASKAKRRRRRRLSNGVYLCPSFKILHLAIYPDGTKSKASGEGTTRGREGIIVLLCGSEAL